MRGWTFQHLVVVKLDSRDASTEKENSEGSRAYIRTRSLEVGHKGI